MQSSSISIAYEGLIKYYDSLVDAGKPVCPIAHTYISCNVGVLINKDGEFLCAQVPSVKGELVPVPCTIESDGRTRNISPHLLHDQLCYVTYYSDKYKEKYSAYINQLKSYVDSCPEDMYANAVYKYVSKNTLMSDIKDILDTIQLKFPKENMNIIFCVYGMDNEGIDLKWTDWYLSKLKINGLCHATGEKDYIPESYPKCTTSNNGKEVLFTKYSHIGYIASQKIIHTIQYLSYGRENHERVETEYKFIEFLKGDTSEKDLKDWIDNNYPSKWDRAKELLLEKQKESS